MCCKILGLTTHVYMHNNDLKLSIRFIILYFGMQTSMAALTRQCWTLYNHTVIPPYDLLDFPETPCVSPAPPPPVSSGQWDPWWRWNGGSGWSGPLCVLDEADSASVSIPKETSLSLGHSHTPPVQTTHTHLHEEGSIHHNIKETSQYIVTYVEIDRFQRDSMLIESTLVTWSGRACHSCRLQRSACVILYLRLYDPAVRDLNNPKGYRKKHLANFGALILLQKNHYVKSPGQTLCLCDQNSLKNFYTCF